LIHQLPDNKVADLERTEWLTRKGFKVLRFTNEQVLENHEEVLKNIVFVLSKQPTINEDPSTSEAFGPSPSTTLINEEPNTPSRREGERNSELGDNKNLQQTSTSFTPFGGQGAEASEIVSPGEVQGKEQPKQINEDPSKSGAFGPSPSTTLINEEPNTPSRGEGERNSELGDNKNLQQTSTSFTPFGGQGAEASEIVSPVSKQDNSTDYIGAFAVTIHGAREHIDRFASQNDEYNKIMVQILADRFVEAFAECLHEKTRKEFWGYEKNENLTNQQLIKEEYKGIRPAPGYPACPDHTEKIKLFDLLKVTENIGIELTESLAMNPPASVCGWYIAHPQSHYFGLGKIQRDQLEDYAKRKGMPIEEAERWLRPVLD
jgi:hypothetical protein